MTQTQTDDVFDSPDPFQDNEFGIVRPERTEDKVPRDKNGWPKILPPDKKVMRDGDLRSYARASGYGKVLENTYNIERYNERNTADGMVKSAVLRLEWAGTGPEDKDRRNELVVEAKKEAKADDKSRIGSAVHAITERHDLGLSLKSIPEEYVPDLEAWIDKTKHFDILGVENFVVEDTYRIAGTYDRLVHYHRACEICGKHKRILDLKTGRVDFGQIGMAVQLASYAHARSYDPATGERTDQDVCLCRGIIVNLPAGTGQASLHWINIAQGWNLAVRLADEVKAIRRKRNWMAEFTTMPNLLPLIAAANSRDEALVIFNMHQSVWTDELTKAVERRLEEIAKQGKAL